MLNNVRKNNTLLLIILVVLVVVAYFLITFDVENVQLEVGENKFTVNEPGNIDSIWLANNSGSFTFVNQGDRWSIDDEYLLDLRLQKLLLAVLNQVNVTRPVSNRQLDSVLHQLQNMGAQIKVYQNGESVKSFLVAGNELQQRTYFMEAGTKNPFLVGIPGYNSYIASLFFLNRNQWRDKVIFKSTFRSLQTLSLDYASSYAQSHAVEDMQVTYKDDFFEVEGVDQLDSAALFNYLKNYNYFEANNYLDNSTSINLDSLDAATPYLTVTLTDIDSTLNNQLALYDHTVNIRGTAMIPGKIIDQSEWALIPKQQADALSQPVDKFIREQEESTEIPLDDLPQ